MLHRYGPQLAESMLGCCNTKLFLQTIDSETRQWASQTIGECEVEIQTMTDALAEGDEKMRTPLGRMRKMRPAVLASELRLASHQGTSTGRASCRERVIPYVSISVVSG